MKTRFRLLVEKVLRSLAYKKMQDWVDIHTDLLYSWIEELKTNKQLIPVFYKEINGVPVTVALIDFGKPYAGYDPDTKMLMIFLKSFDDMYVRNSSTAIEHEFIHAYHDLILHLPIKKEYDFAKINAGDREEFKKYCNSEEEFTTNSEEILYYILRETKKYSQDVPNADCLSYANNLINKLFSVKSSDDQSIHLSKMAFISYLTPEHKLELKDYLENEIKERYGE